MSAMSFLAGFWVFMAGYHAGELRWRPRVQGVLTLAQVLVSLAMACLCWAGGQ